MQRVVVTDHMFPDLHHEQAAARECDAELVAPAGLTDAEVPQALEGADVALIGTLQVGEEALRRLNPGAVVIRYGIGFDCVDIDAATTLGIRVCNIPDYGADTVADHTAMLALASLRHLDEYNRALKDGNDGWCAPADVGVIPALSDVTVGLVGVGQIGLLVAHRLQAFGARIIAADPYADAEALAGSGVELVSLPDLLATADIVSLHAPLSDETRHLIDTAALDAMKDSAILVNTGRGGLVDTAAAAQAVTAGRLGGLAFDVFESEPLEADSPLRRSPHTLLSPHSAFYSTRAMDNLQRFAAEEMARALRGEPLRCPLN
ncbi:C-terminal binding protein [Brevibacterium sp. 5221]|uniref:C-terminal binding protein n=1 Tax=Brevibacterium rongguiense TaxID=2695267 RepID=A0A6N9H8T3_9MICO|nr:C-terminal binding protein [Brevibacterium rongguiense]MYM20448.1 C-terminal binding protein [Brevibacterium rongguiense]